MAALSYRLLALAAEHSRNPAVAERAAQLRHAFDWLPVRVLAASCTGAAACALPCSASAVSPGLSRRAVSGRLRHLRRRSVLARRSSHPNQNGPRFQD